MIRNEEIARDLYTIYYEIIRKDSNFLSQEKEITEFFKTSTEYTNTENIELLFGLYSKDYLDYLNLKKKIENTFTDFDLRYETQVLKFIL